MQPILSTLPTPAHWVPYPPPAIAVTQPPAVTPVTPSRACGGVPRENSGLTVHSQSTAASSGTATSSGTSASGGVSTASREDAGSLERPTYSAPLCVRRTFIDYPVERTPSLDEFLKERQVPHSWPSSRVQEVERPDPGVDAVSEVTTPMPRHTQSATSWLESATAANSRESSDEDESPTAGIRQLGSGFDDFVGASVASGPALGSAALPTVGSAGHNSRRCKPCAFVLKGCNSGIHCPFCHLCEPGEKKRRRKEKVAARKTMGNRLRQSFSNGIGHFSQGFFS